MQRKPNETQKSDNFLVKDAFLMNGSCITSSISHQATIKCNDSKCKQKE